MDTETEEIILPKDYDLDFQRWMLDNSYAIKTIKNYHKNIMSLMGVSNKITIPKIKKFLSTKKDSLSKRSAIKLLVVFLEDSYNIIIPSFRYPRITNESNPLEVISLDDFKAICKQLDPFMSMYARVMYYGGLRVSEVAKIRTEDFDWGSWMKNKEDYGSLRIIKSKRNKTRIVPISPGLMKEIFDFADKDEEGYLKNTILFNFKYGKTYAKKNKDYEFYIKKKIQRQKYRPEIAKKRYVDKIVRLFQIRLKEASEKKLGRKVKTHMLRASRATHADEKGLSPTSIQNLLGHENLATTSRYIINTPEKLKKDMKKLEL